MLLLPVLTFLVAAPVSGSPRTVVLVTQRTEVSEKEGLALAVEAQRQLAAAGVRVDSTAGALKQLAKLSFADTSACDGRKVCVTELGRQLSVEVVVGLSVADLEDDRAVSFEALRIRDGVVLAREQLVFPRKKGLPAKGLLAFAAALLAPAPPEPPPEPPPPSVALDTPVLPPQPPVLTPQVTAPALMVVEPVAPSRTVPIVALSAAGAATVVGVVLLAVHLVNRNALAPQQGVLRLTYPEALAARDRANGTLVGAAVCAGLAAALGTTAAVTW
jgi:hypothetical protein